jgi:dihydroorotate dehydrogenase (fumarate)
VHDSESAIKLLLAGAKTVQVCSALYKNGPEYRQDYFVNGIGEWMDEKGIRRSMIFAAG